MSFIIKYMSQRESVTPNPSRKFGWTKIASLPLKTRIRFKPVKPMNYPTQEWIRVVPLKGLYPPISPQWGNCGNIQTWKNWIMTRKINPKKVLFCIGYPRYLYKYIRRVVDRLRSILTYLESEFACIAIYFITYLN